jgi:hypothetical protein
MAKYMTLEDIERESANKHIKANELDVLVSKTRELTSIQEQELIKLKKLHDQLVQRLEGMKNS